MSATTLLYHSFLLRVQRSMPSAPSQECTESPVTRIAHVMFHFSHINSYILAAVCSKSREVDLGLALPPALSRPAAVVLPVRARGSDRPRSCSDTLPPLSSRLTAVVRSDPVILRHAEGVERYESVDQALHARSDQEKCTVVICANAV